jgi:hypothetical protein
MLYPTSNNKIITKKLSSTKKVAIKFTLTKLLLHTAITHLTKLQSGFLQLESTLVTYFYHKLLTMHVL